MREEAYYYDFGDVAIGTKKIHKINVHNETSVLQSYFVDLDQNTNSYVSKSFCIKPMKCGIESNANIEFQVTYHARTPDHQYRYYFTIIRSDGFHTNVSMKASCVGPKVHSSTNTLTFNCIEKNQTQSKCFYLMNKGAVPALYNLNNNSFGQVKIEPLYGCIPPSEKIRVIVTFKSKHKKTHYFKLLVCLILYQSPILLNVINIAESDKNKIDLNKMVITPETVPKKPICESFSGRSSNQSSNLFSLVSVKEEYINFGSCIAGKCVTKDLLVTNACGVNITIIWEEDESGVFNIIATKYIQAFSKGNIAVKFCPPIKDKLYFSKLSASIFWGQYLTSIRTTISLLGNSFENPSCGWLTQYEIEPCTLNIESNLSNIILPGCFPNDVSMSTFLIRRNGHVPLSFTFHPPSHSQFILKPMLGLIQGSFQIITVLLIDSEFQRIKGLNHKEMWTIKFNESGLTHQLLLEGCIEESKLIVNFSLPVTFPTTHPLCSQIHSVTVRNPTQNTLRYSFYVTEGEDVLKIDGSKYVIESNQIIQNNWIFTPSAPGMYEGEVTCHYSDSLNNKFNFPIKFSGHCKIGHLKTEPTFFSMASVLIGTWENEIFHLINDGECTLHVTLDCHPCTLLSLKGETYLEPSKITINPGDSVEVEVCTTPGGLNHHDIQIGCYYRLCEVSDVILENSWTPLIRFDVIGVYPELIISDIRLSPLKYITKYNIWKIMEVNRINQLWKTVYTLLQNQRAEIYLPSSTENSCPILILILIKNMSKVPTDLSIFQEKTCDCKKIEKQFGINVFKMVSVCQHKEQITLNPQKMNIKESTSVTLAIEVHYNLVGEQEQTFCFKINPEKMPWLAVSLTITFIRYAIPNDEPMIWPALPYRYKTKESYFKMIPVFIGQQKPLVQAYWVYNSSCHSVDYNVSSQKVPNKAFSCINSTGTIKPFSLHPLLFTFISYELNECKARFKLKTKYLQLYIYVECESSVNFSKINIYKMLNKMPLASLLSATPIQLTMDHIVFTFLPLHSTAEKIFYLSNFTGEKLYISWTRVDLPGILCLRVVPKKSYIEPFECVLFKVTCKTSYQPCLITCNLICKVIKLKASGNFDVCTLQTDNEQDGKQTSFNKTKETLICLSVTVHANNLSFLNLNNIMKCKMGTEINDLAQNKSSSLLSREVADIITDIFGKILWRIVSSPYVQHSLETGYPPIYYEEFLQNKENKRIIKCPLEVTKQIFSNVISQLVSECFIKYLPKC